MCVLQERSCSRKVAKVFSYAYLLHFSAPPYAFDERSSVSRPASCSIVLTAQLSGTDPPKAFDFLVNGELVRLSLEQLLLANSVSAVRVGASAFF